jgi:DNA transposition AAA+ family ATPase
MIAQKTEHFTPEQTALLDRVNAQLAAGLGLMRLQLETGLREDYLRSLINYQPLSGRNADRDEQEGLEVLALWLEDIPAARDPGHAETPTFKAITRILSMAYQNHTLIGITGAVGVGKSLAVARYAADHPRTHKQAGAVRIQFNKTDNKPAAALAALLEGLHGGNSAGSYRNGDLYRAVGAMLRPGDFLILDECQRLGEALDLVASLYDDFGIGMALIGNPDFSRVVWGKDRTFDALGSRILRYDFPHSTEADVETWLAWKLCLDRLPVKERKSLIKTAIRIGARPGREGGLRTLSQIFGQADIYENQSLSGALIDALYHQLKESA